MGRKVKDYRCFCAWNKRTRGGYVYYTAVTDAAHWQMDILIGVAFLVGA